MITETVSPRTVEAAKLVNLALVTYVDDYGKKTTQLTLVGDNNLHLLNMKDLGLSNEKTISGLAADWIRDGVFKILKRKK